MFAVFWIENSTPDCKVFNPGEMSAALKFSESLRQRKYSGEAIHFITLASENPNSVGKQGVDVTGPDYDWKKRRI